MAKHYCGWDGEGEVHAIKIYLTEDSIGLCFCESGFDNIKIGDMVQISKLLNEAAEKVLKVALAMAIMDATKEANAGPSTENQVDIVKEMMEVSDDFWDEHRNKGAN